MVDNNAADNNVGNYTDNSNFGQAYDLFDVQTFFQGLDTCLNTGSANVWGSAGFNPACTAAGGSGPPGSGSARSPGRGYGRRNTPTRVPAEAGTSPLRDTPRDAGC